MEIISEGVVQCQDLPFWPDMLETKAAMMSIGRGKMTVVLFSEEMLLRVWRYLSWRAAGESAITSAACLRALLALCSPSAAIT